MSGTAGHERLLNRALTEIRQLRARVAQLEQGQSQPIAVIGIGCRYPGGASTPERFWESTRDGQDAIGAYPPVRLANFASIPDPLPASTLLGGFLDAVDSFDCGFFAIAPREARSMDLRQRLLLEVCHEALEDALIPSASLAGSRGAMFLGLYNDDFAQLHMRLDRPDGLDGYLGTGTSHSIAAARLAYQLDLRGPALALDAACASSLAAVHLACASLRLNESDLALAAGINLILSPLFGIVTDRMGMMAPDGRCKPFDSRADGFVRSEGCGVVVLKRLSDALAAGDPIRAVILGSAMNQDGATNGITAPNGDAQKAVIEAALADAKVAPAEIGYIECHGTGTPLGDPVEVDALARIHSAPRPQPCMLGSVKANIGHTEAASGIAGLIRAVLAVQRREIPAVAHFQTLNPYVDLGPALALPRAPVPWTDAEPRAGVSAFGWSGSNVHVVVGPAPPLPPARDDTLGAAGHLLPLSAASDAALRGLVARTTDWLSDADADLPALCAAAWFGRDHRRHRLAVCGGTSAELRDRLLAWHNAPTGALTGPALTGVHAGVTPAVPPRAVLIFPGQGGQWPGMARQLLQEDAVFRATFDAVSQAAEAVTERPLTDELMAADRFGRIDIIQPVIFAVQVALARWLRAHGVSFDAVGGHSMGEVAAACVAGALTLADGARVITRRSQLLKTITDRGAMLVTELSADEAEAALKSRRSRISIAAINGPRTTVLSGDQVAIEALRAELDDRGVFCRPVKVDVASHSPQVDPLVPPLQATLRDLVPGPAQAGVRFYSTVTASVLDGGALGSPYWGRNLRAPVRFAETVRQLADDGHGIFIEVNPHPVLGPSLRECLNGAGTVIQTLHRDRAEPQALIETLAAIHVAGGALDKAALYARRRTQRLPGIVWAREPSVRPVPPINGLAAVNDLYGIDWQPLPDAAPPTTAGKWLILDRVSPPGDDLAEALTEALAAHSASAALIRLRSPDALTSADLLGFTGIVYLGARADAATDSDPVTTQDWQSIALLRLTQRLTALGTDELQGVWLITRGAEVVSSADVSPPMSGANCGQGALSGFLRVAAAEQVSVPLRLVDLPARPAEGEAGWLARHVLSGEAEDHVALREGHRLAARLARRGVAISPHPLRLDPGGMYVITGGLGGIGLRLTRQLAAWGARQIGLLGRNPPSPDAAEALEKLRAHDVSIQVLSADVADTAALARALATLRDTAPLRGIFHVAAVIDDAVIENLEPARMASVFGSKLGGAWNLHHLTLADQIGHFVLFSSAAAILGTPGQANYAAANGAVDALARLRAANGLPANAIAWGPWTEIGLAAADARRGDRLQARGLHGMTPRSCFRALERILAGPSGVTAVMRIDAPAWAEHYPTAMVRPFMHGLRTNTQAAEPAAEEPDFAGALRAAPPGQPARHKLTTRIAAEIAIVLGIESRQVRLDTPLRTIGLDSLMALELRTRLERLTGQRLPATLVWTYPTPERLAGHLAERMGLGPAASEGDLQPEVARVPAVADTALEALSDEGALALLMHGGA
jgi:acyl transferase domain-containing protein/NAD(P)-dependent dehydrogenase (short-subunit alcohol dehydrogenase family)/acyl carrier protein